MLSTLPILRRPATSADRLPANLYIHFHGRLKLLLGGQGGDVYVRYVRRVRVADGSTFYLVPATKLGRPPLSPDGRGPLLPADGRRAANRTADGPSSANELPRADTATLSSRSAATTSKPRASTKACS